MAVRGRCIGICCCHLGTFLVFPNVSQRYLAYVDGTSFSDRLFWLLLTDSLVFKAGSSIRVWLDAGLQAWTHYVPVHGNLSETGMQCAKKKSEWRNLPRIE